MAYQETFVHRGQHRIYVRDYPGEDPPIVLMHGFPDNLHLYDRLVPHLTPPRRVVLFDFLGWGSSDKPAGYPYTTANQVGDIDAVITQLKLGPAVLVVHDASGPPGIDCCARAATGHAAAAPPMSVMKSRRLMGAYPKAKHHGEL